jgi:hypothetical protein
MLFQRTVNERNRKARISTETPEDAPPAVNARSHANALAAKVNPDSELTLLEHIDHNMDEKLRGEAPRHWTINEKSEPINRRS